MKQTKIQNAKHNSLHQNLLITGGVAAGLLLLVYILLGIYPFGDGTVLTGDLNGQYINYFAHYKRFFSGEAGFLYGFDKSLGGGLLGIFAYYVSSPLNLLYLVAPVEDFPQVASVLFFVKILLSSVFCGFWLHQKFPDAGRLLIALALGYGFMSYGFAYAQSIMWHDVLMLLPLACYGVDRIMAGKSNTVYILTLALAILANFYIAYMACLFLALYFVCSLLLQNSVTLKSAGRPALHFVMGSLIAGGLSMPLLLPSLLNINQTKGALLNVALRAGSNFSWSELPKQFAFGSFMPGDAEGGLPLMYCGSLVLLLVFCFFVSRTIALRQKLVMGGLLALLLLSFWFSPLDVVWHGLKAPVWFPYRNSFLLCFSLVWVAAMALQQNAAGKIELLVSSMLLAVMFGLVTVFPMDIGRKRPLLTIALILGFCAALLLTERLRKQPHQGLLAVVVIAVTALELGANGFLISNQFEKYSLSGFQEFYSNGIQTVEQFRQQQKSQARIEKNFFRSLNDPMLLDYHGISHFGSTQDNSSVEALVHLGFQGYYGCGTYSYGSTVFADSVLGIQNLFSDKSRPVPAHWEPVQRSGDYDGYHNQYALPMMFGISGEPPVIQPRKDASQLPSPSESLLWQQNLYQALGGQQQLYQSVDSVKKKDARGENQALVGPLQSGGEYLLTAQQEGWHYAWLQAGMYDIEYTIDQQPMGRVFSADHMGLIQLGYLQKGQRVSLGLGQQGQPEIEIVSAEFFSLSPDVIQQFSQKAWQNAADLMIRDGCLQAHLDAAAGLDRVFISVPWDPHWQATVNGVRVEPQPLLNGFMMLPLETGQNNIEMWYRPPGILPGILVGVVSVLGWAGVLLWRKKRQAQNTAGTKESR